MRGLSTWCHTLTHSHLVSTGKSPDPTSGQPTDKVGCQSGDCICIMQTAIYLMFPSRTLPTDNSVHLYACNLDACLSATSTASLSPFIWKKKSWPHLLKCTPVLDKCPGAFRSMPLGFWYSENELNFMWNNVDSLVQWDFIWHCDE